ncbi:MAG: hypothetical protein ACLUD0_19345 [Eubacterium ramulus]
MRDETASDAARYRTDRDCRRNTGSMRSGKRDHYRITARIYRRIRRLDLATAPDDAFAGRMMGDGAVVTPATTCIVSTGRWTGHLRI